MYENQAINSASAGQRIGYEAQSMVAPGEINRLTARLETILNGLRDITADLACHADRLHGGAALAASGELRPRPVRSGAFGNLEDIIDTLGEQSEVLQAAARRNTSLA